MSIRMKSILEKFSAYILIFILIIVNIFLFAGVNNKKKAIQILMKQNTDMNKQIEDALTKYEGFNENIIEKQEQQKEILKKSELFENYFITRDKIPEIMADIQKKADITGVNLVEYDYLPLYDEKLKNFIKLEFTISVNGYYGNMKKFLFNLENLKYILKQSDIDFLKTYDTEIEKEVLELKIKLFTFVRKDVKTVRKD